MDLGDKILGLAEERRLSLREVAELAHVGYGIVRYYTRTVRRAKPPLPVALKLARALEVPLDWLADDSRGFPPPQAPPPFEIHPWPPDITWEQLEACILSGLASNTLGGIAGHMHGIPSNLSVPWLASLPPKTLADLCRRDATIARSLQGLADKIKGRRTQGNT